MCIALPRPVNLILYSPTFNSLWICLARLVTRCREQRTLLTARHKVRIRPSLYFARLRLEEEKKNPLNLWRRLWTREGDGLIQDAILFRWTWYVFKFKRVGYLRPRLCKRRVMTNRSTQDRFYISERLTSVHSSSPSPSGARLLHVRRAYFFLGRGLLHQTDYFCFHRWIKYDFSRGNREGEKRERDIEWRAKCVNRFRERIKRPRLNCNGRCIHGQHRGRVIYSPILRRAGTISVSARIELYRASSWSLWRLASARADPATTKL